MKHVICCDKCLKDLLGSGARYKVHFAYLSENNLEDEHTMVYDLCEECGRKLNYRMNSKEE